MKKQIEKFYINSIEGLIREIKDYQDDLHVDLPEDYEKAEKIQIILEDTLKRLNALA